MSSPNDFNEPQSGQYLNNQGQNQAQQQPFDFSQMETRDLQEVRSNLNALLKHEGMNILQSQLQQQAGVRMNALINTTSGGIDGCIDREFMRGALNAFTFVISFPQMLINGIEQELDDRGKAGRREEQ